MKIQIESIKLEINYSIKMRKIIMKELVIIQENKINKEITNMKENNRMVDKVLNTKVNRVVKGILSMRKEMNNFKNSMNKLLRINSMIFKVNKILKRIKHHNLENNNTKEDLKMS